MPEKIHFSILTCLVLLAGLSACAPDQTEPVVELTPELPDAAETPAVLHTPTPLPGLLPVEVFSAGSAFCLPETERSSFDLNCSQDTLTVTQAADRLKIDGLLTRGAQVEAGQFNLEVDTLSLASGEVKTDQNAYGFYFVDQDGVYKAVRVQGQYFNFETWSLEVEPQIQTQLRPAYSPFIKPAGQVNHWRLACSPEYCDLYANEELVGRSTNGINAPVNTVGIFTSAAWDELFGQVDFSALDIHSQDERMPVFEPYELSDSLRSESGTFSQIGLSGAFSDYQDDGFHFSPVIAYGYYGAKAGAALENVEVSAKVRMQVDPDKPGSQYGGLICRSSKEGMYMAVIGVDGTYTIYRDTPQKPFTLLAERKSDAILPGLVENELRLVCSGNTIDFYVNGQQVEALTDTRYNLNYGRAGIYTKAGGEPNEDAIVFSDLSIKEIK